MEVSELRIETLIDNPDQLTRASIRNTEKAAEYEESILTQRRNEFYSKLLQIANREH